MYEHIWIFSRSRCLSILMQSDRRRRKRRGNSSRILTWDTSAQWALVSISLVGSEVLKGDPEAVDGSGIQRMHDAVPTVRWRGGGGGSGAAIG
jgi:hypothetical protein